MNYRTLGRTGLSVSEVGFGGAGIGHVWGPTTDDECIQAVQLALDLGINFFDTSPMYGGGRSEENLGKGLSGRRKEAIIATKVRLQSEEERTGIEAMAGAVQRSIEQSLKRLGTDYVDILQVHHQVGVDRGQYMAAVGPPPRYALLLNQEDCQWLGEAMKHVVEQGKARFLGITAWDGHRDALKAVLESGAFDTAQILYNILNQTADSLPPPGFDDIDQGQSLPFAQANDIGVIGIRAHAAGALSDRVDRETAPDSEVARDHGRAMNIAPLIQGRFSSLSQAALRFTLDHSALSTVVPGFKSATEVQEAAACSDLPPIDETTLRQIDSLYRRQFGTG